MFVVAMMFPYDAGHIKQSKYVVAGLRDAVPVSNGVLVVKRTSVVVAHRALHTV